MGVAEAIVPDSEVARFQEHGVMVLRDVFGDWVDILRRGVDANMNAPSFRERSYQPDDGSAPFFQDFCNWSRIPEFRDFVFHSPIAGCAAQLMRSRTARFFHDHILVKEPGSSVVTPWHHDQPYYCVAGRQNVSFWIPLDPISREIAIEYVAGSHLWGKDYRPKRFDGSDLYPGDSAEEMPDIGGLRDELEIVGWAMEPGDAVAFTFLTVHGAPANTSPRLRRRVFSARWVGDDAVFADRGAPTSPPFPDLALEDGEALDDPEFPLVYRASN